MKTHGILSHLKSVTQFWDKLRERSPGGVLDTELDEARGRIPDQWKGVYTFYGRSDWWLYVAIHDDVTCKTCQGWESWEWFPGDALRKYFPYHEISSPNYIKPNVHPNCRCILIRKEWLEEALRRGVFTLSELVKQFDTLIDIIAPQTL